MVGLEERMDMETVIEQEFSDEFITQVYNYMSLGYPSVARDFDEELAKAAKVPITDLQQDDNLPRSRGYIRLGPDNEAKDGVTEESCARWRALRVYIHDWARQQPSITKTKPMETGWVAARKGSWAL